MNSYERALGNGGKEKTLSFLCCWHSVVCLLILTSWIGCLILICAWPFSYLDLSLNKTEAKITAPPDLHSEVSQTLTSFCSAAKSSVQNLNVIFDSFLGFLLHVKSLFISASYQMHCCVQCLITCSESAVPPKKLKTRWWACQSGAPRLWKSLPLKLHLADSVESFENQLKTFLFN